MTNESKTPEEEENELNNNIPETLEEQRDFFVARFEYWLGMYIKQKAVVDELRKENTAMRIFAKKAVDGLKDAYDCLVEAHGQHMDCEKATDQEHEMMHICERGYIKIDVLLTDPICIELLK